MAYDVVLKNINKHISLDTDEISYFTSLLKEKKVSKRAMILKDGQVCKEISFVKSGALRAYYRDKTGKESTIMFAITDWWVTDMFCFVNEQPAMLNIEAIEDSVVLQLLKADLDKLYIKIPKFERFFRIIMQNAYIREQLRVIQNLSLPANERYNLFLSKYPEIVKQVKQKQIASYLGITPEFLSMLRRNKRTKRIS
ncbi:MULTISPECIES: Crp/Fnr family transcriptional regulator [Olivibacter]|jgi:CRP-like cAMP-binding protein|uniref:Crp/Fnr family transcriptional regulator n=2 Tax=Olivibacter TaxID=376469 RepID=A0ABV6HH27_9SPHI|nr:MULTISPECIES: Crp/Fnr family transcriptional regulator [Olivibacter]MDM8176880.1 Crp/Fnr family transcriptional regulator [Olivibacter sp. 47]QEL00645.1 Crp/Fnr family transcriptional regulator [Olivibacter sp. LS-1]